LRLQLVGIARLADDLEAGILEQARDALAQQHRVVGEDDPRASAEPDVGGVGAERREVGRAELVEPHGLVDASELMLAEIAHGGAAAEQAHGRLREQHLAAVTRRADAGGTVHVETHVAAVDADRLAGVDADPDADGADRRLLNRLGRSDRLPRIDESDRELVAATVDLLAAVLDERGADGDAMLLERRRIVVTKRLYEPRRALDVGEQEGDAHTTSLRSN